MPVNAPGPAWQGHIEYLLQSETSAIKYGDDLTVIGEKLASKRVFPSHIGGTGKLYDEAAGHGLYILRNPKTNAIEYVGRGDAPKRIASHAKPGSGKEDLVAEILWNNNLPMEQAVSLERELMHLLGGPKSLRSSTTTLRNKIDSLSPQNPNHIGWEFAADDDLLIETLMRADIIK